MAKDSYGHLNPDAQAFYVSVIEELNRQGINFVVGGGYALARFTGIERAIKDVDIFLKREDFQAAIHVLEAAGHRTEFTFSHWLGKVYDDANNYIDIIFDSGNGLCPVDDDWFDFAYPGIILGVPIKICPAEELLWTKSFIMERERFDGADVAHIIRARAKSLNWRRLLKRFGSHWRILLSHLILFGFIYPGDRRLIPAWVMNRLLASFQQEAVTKPDSDRTCQGTMLSRAQYLVDIESWGFKDARLTYGCMSEEQITDWTAPVKEEAFKECA